jgi:serine/threonine-protein kinase
LVTLLGNYRLIAELGHGGMGQVFLALMEGPARFAKLAVIKRLREHLLEDHEFVSMLLEEARITSRLSHPNVVQLLEVGTAGEEHFLVMEYLEGESFSRLRRRAQNRKVELDANGQLAVIADALSGLHYAHELADYDGTPLDVVHRDFTPSNVFITCAGHVKVVDFGIARAAGRANETRQGIVKGKIRYMAPEQATGHAVDRRADLFAAAIMIWEAAAGRRFWDCADEDIGLRLVAGRYERSPRAVNPNVHPAIDQLCRRALEPDPNDRIATAAEMRLVLEQVLGDGLPAARRAMGQRVSELFAREREKIRACIDAEARAAAGPANELPGRLSKVASSLTPLVVGEALPSAKRRPSSLKPPRSTAPAPAPEESDAAATVVRVSSEAGVTVAPTRSSFPSDAGAIRRSGAMRTAVLGAVTALLVVGGVLMWALLDAQEATANAERSARTAVVTAAKGFTSTAAASAAPPQASRDAARARVQTYATAWQRHPPIPPPRPTNSDKAGKPTR